MQTRERFQFNNARMRAECSDRVEDGSGALLTGDGCRTWRWDTLTVKMVCGKDEVWTVSVHNHGAQDLILRKLVLEWRPEADARQPDARDYVQLHHPQGFEMAGIRPLHRPNDWSDPAEASAMVTVFSHRQSGEALLLGALPPYGDCFVSFPILHESAHRDGAFGLSIQLAVSHRIAAGGQETLAHLTILGGGNGVALLQQYGELMRSRIPQALLGKRRITGWNSWDYYAGAVTQLDVARNARAARERYGESVRYIVIDEGYECQWGEWEAGWKFPDGLQALCESIRGEGFEPGIWTAPLMVNVYTPLYREHPNWFVGDEAGNPYVQNLGYGAMVQLDITLPEVQEHIGGIFTRLRQAGFTYFKCDFTQLLVGASRFSRDDLSPSGMLRKLFRLIRESIGDEAYLLACGAPYETVIGVADSHRTTGDIHHYWSHIRQNIRSMLARWWMQGTVGNTDPDFAIVRCEATTSDKQLSRRMAHKPWQRGGNFYAGREMNLEEAQTLLLACYVSGGDMVLGDALEKLNEKGHGMLSAVLREPVQGCVPINMFDCGGDDLPIVVAQGAGQKLLAVFNLSDDYLRQSLPQPYAGLKGPHKEFWSGQPVEALEAEQFRIPPRSAMAWWLSEAAIL